MANPGCSEPKKIPLKETTQKRGTQPQPKDADDHPRPQVKELSLTMDTFEGNHRETATIVEDVL